MTVKDIANNLLSFFKTGDVKDSFGTYRQFFLVDEHPKWLKSIIYRVHEEDNMLPDDFKYEFVYRALLALAENDDPYEATIEPDAYTSELMRWMNSHSYRQARVDEALQSGIANNMFDAMQYAQSQEMDEVLNIVREELVEYVESEEEGE